LEQHIGYSVVGLSYAKEAEVSDEAMSPTDKVPPPPASAKSALEARDDAVMEDRVAVHDTTLGDLATAVAAEVAKLAPKLVSDLASQLPSAFAERAERRREVESESAQLSANERQALRDFQLAVASHDIGRDVTRLEANMRACLAGALVVGTLLIVAYGVIAERPAAVLVQYLAPVTGLAGLAVGYFFGQASSGNPRAGVAGFAPGAKVADGDG